MFNASGDFNQFVGADGLALDPESLTQILQVLGVETEDEAIKQAVCTFTDVNQVQANMTAANNNVHSGICLFLLKWLHIPVFSLLSPVSNNRFLFIQSLPTPPNGIVPSAACQTDL